MPFFVISRQFLQTFEQSYYQLQQQASIFFKSTIYNTLIHRSYKKKNTYNTENINIMLGLENQYSTNMQNWSASTSGGFRWSNSSLHPPCSTSPSILLYGSSTSSQSITKPTSFAWQVWCGLQELFITPTMCKVELTHVTFST